MQQQEYAKRLHTQAVNLHTLLNLIAYQLKYIQSRVETKGT